jgi:hypothetical protein
MTEATIQAGIQDVIQAMPEFAGADVVINDWGIFDQSSSHAPYVLIQSADEVTSRQDVKTAQTVYMIPVMLVERFTNWKETYDNFTTRRDAILTKFNAVGAARSANGIAATTVDVIRSEGPIGEVYPAYLEPEERAEALPEFVVQTLIFETEEY